MERTARTAVHRRRGIWPLVAALLWTLAVRGPDAWAAPSLFGTSETPHADLQPFPKWTGSLERYFRDQKALEGACADLSSPACKFSFWFETIEGLRGKPEMAQLNAVNRILNKYRYVVDPVNWGVKDYWAIPQEFFKKYGDCEDYAISKYLTLRALGWPPERLRIVILRDMNLKVMHAILAVEMGGDFKILDNQISLVVDSKRIHHYSPVFSVSETGWWRHKAAGAAGGAVTKVRRVKVIKRVKVIRRVN